MFRFTAAWKEIWNLMYLWRRQGKPIASLLRRLCLWRSLKFDVQSQKSLKISKKCQFAATHLSGIFYTKFFSAVCSLSVSLCAQIASPADVTDYTRTVPTANSMVNQSGAYFQNFENSQKIEEITYNFFFSPTWWGTKEFFDSCKKKNNNNYNNNN